MPEDFLPADSEFRETTEPHFDGQSGSVENLPLGDQGWMLDKTWAHLTGGKTKRKDAKTVFASLANCHSIYEWGMAVALQKRPENGFRRLCRIAADEPIKLSKKIRGQIAAQCDRWMIDLDQLSEVTLVTAVEAVLWAASLRHLHPVLGDDQTRALTRSLINLHDAAWTIHTDDAPASLILRGELGLTLAWKLPRAGGMKERRKRASESIVRWCEAGSLAVDCATDNPLLTRLVLASLMRCGCLIDAVAKRRLTKAYRQTGDLLATWVAAMTMIDGRSAFSDLIVSDCRADDGLLESAKQFDPESLSPAFDAATGNSKSGGRLAWQVSLPETMWCSDQAKLAILLPEWDSRKGRTHVQFGSRGVDIEVFSGRAKVLSGKMSTDIAYQGVTRQPESDWELICEYSDDDVHYIELEQRWSGGLVLQRQFLQLREDECLFVSDAVVPNQESNVFPKLVGVPEGGQIDRDLIDYRCRYPLAEGVSVDSDDQIREHILIAGKKKVLALPLAASEWRVGHTRCKLEPVRDTSYESVAGGDRGDVPGKVALETSALEMTAQGTGRLFVPLWLDFGRRRIKQKRTWRSLTVGDSLRICRPDEAVAFRIQSGIDQWVVYRSLVGQRCRTFLGKHMMADFFASRFDASDGSHEALITVDDRDD